MRELPLFWKSQIRLGRIGGFRRCSRASHQEAIYVFQCHWDNCKTSSGEKGGYIAKVQMNDMFASSGIILY